MLQFVTLTRTTASEVARNLSILVCVLQLMYSLCCNLQNSKSVNVWHKELATLGYEEPLPAPIPAVQVVICAMKESRLHHFIQEQDLFALADIDDEGNSAPLLLTTLDLSDWTHLLVIAGNNPENGLTRLRSAHSKLAEILEKDILDVKAADKSVPLLERVLQHANSGGTGAAFSSKLEDISSADDNHPLLAKIRLTPDEQAALEHFKEALLASSCDVRSLLRRKSGKRLTIPLAPPRSVEHSLMFRGHKAWNLPCMSLLAPITVHMWQSWSRLTSQEVEACRIHALNNTGQIRDPVLLPHAFPLSIFDQSKCSRPSVKLHTKQDLPTGEFRREKHLAEFWNCGRPYLRCSCNSQAANDGGCDGSVIWWDHAMWFMINRLELFFGDEYPTLTSKLAAFWIWISSSGKVAVKSHLTFAFRRDLMLEGVIEFAHNQTGPLLMKYGDAAGVRKIERYIKPASFSLSNPTPAAGNKKQKIIMNAHSSSDRGSGREFGRGGYNKNYRVAAKKAVSPFVVFEKEPFAAELQNIDVKPVLKKAKGSCDSEVVQDQALKSKDSIWEDEGS